MSLALALAACHQGPPRDLILLSVDTLRADALGVAGSPQARTPHLDRLIGSGTYFTQAIAPMPRTTPALGTLLTGLWPQHHGSREVGDPIGDVVTLAEVLSHRGYQTLAVVANATAGAKQRLDRGFERFVGYGELERAYGERLYRDLPQVGHDNVVGWATAVTDQALALMQERTPDRPFFLWLFYFDPHFVYLPPPPYWSPERGGACWELYQSFDGRREQGGQLFADVRGVASAALDSCRELYRAEVSYLDEEIGRLLAELDATAALDRAHLVFTADHGENLGEGGLFFEHGDNAHDAGLRVPLAFVGPGIASGRRDPSSVGLVDVVPTVLELLEVPTAARPPVDGIDLSARLRVDSPPPAADEQRPLFAESATSMWNEAVNLLMTGRQGWRVCVNDERFALCRRGRDPENAFELFDHRDDPELTANVAAQHPEVIARLAAGFDHWPHENARQRVARTPRWKLIQLPRLDGGYDSHLYDLDADPAEAVDVKDQHRQVFRRLRAALDEWAAALPRTSQRTEDPEIEKSLQALGYLGGAKRPDG